MKIETVASPNERLKQAFTMSGLKQTDLVEKTGIDKSSISLYLSGKVTPKGNKLYRLAVALDVDPVWLSGFDVPMKHIPQKSTYTLDPVEREIIETYRKADARQKMRIGGLIAEIADEIEKNAPVSNGNGKVG